MFGPISIGASGTTIWQVHEPPVSAALMGLGQGHALDADGAIWYAGIVDVTHGALYCLDQAGDMNEDGLVNNLDIDSFALALVDFATWQTNHPKVNILAAGVINLDGQFNNLDSTPFGILLTGGGRAGAEP